MLNQDYLKDIVGDLHDQKAVLLIGPDIITSDGLTLKEALYKHLQENCGDAITYYYERDGFYLFNPNKKMRIGRAASEFYKNVKLNETLLQRIVQIPFDLIVSINPDTTIADAFNRYGVPPSFYSFKHGGEGQELDNRINNPTKTQPVVYNLFGSKDQDASFVLDYNDFYKMLKSLLGASGLPTKLHKKLKDARTYIFIGFQFDKWYAQLLLKLLQDDSYNDKILSLNGKLPDEKVSEFVIKQFDIEFIDNDVDFFGNLYKHCEEAKILRGELDDTPCPDEVYPKGWTVK